MFKIKSNESISEMFARLMQFINNLKAQGKEYFNSNLVRKVLRSLILVWHTKATMIEDSKNLSTISLNELIGSLMTYELNLKRNEDDRKKKIIASRLRKNPKPQETSLMKLIQLLIPAVHKTLIFSQEIQEFSEEEKKIFFQADS